MKKYIKAIICVLVIWLCLYIGSNYINNHYGFFTIVTYQSMPIHFGFACKTEKCLKNIKTGDIIIFKKYFEDKYIPDNGILIKYVMCNEGDNLTVDSDKIYYCNGQFFTVAKDTDSKGNPVKNFVYNGKIPKGKVFVSGVGRNSYDSKYFGFIDKDKILYKVYPIL